MRRQLYCWRLTNWLMAEPWKIYPLFKTGWRYDRIWNSLGCWPIMRRHPLRRAWETITFPHVHLDEDDD